MANRKTMMHSDIVRNRIRTSALINRLQEFVDGKIELSAAQVTAALGLIRKTVPDLASVEHSGEVEHVYVMAIPAIAETADEWTTQHAPLQIQ
jgi:hypothetical protein